MYRGDILPPEHHYIKAKSEDIGIGHFLVTRMKQHLGFDLKEVEELVPETVHRLTFGNGKVTKTLYYVKEYLGNYGPGYKWLLDKNFDFTALLVKGFPYSINKHDTEEYENQFAGLRKAVLRILSSSLLKNDSSQRFSVITDHDERDNPFVAAEASPIKVVKNTVFGYHERMNIYDHNALIPLLSLCQRI